MQKDTTSLDPITEALNQPQTLFSKHIHAPTEQYSGHLLQKMAHFQLLQARHGHFLINPNDAYIGQSFIHYGEYSYQEWQLLEELIVRFVQGDILEIGANMGSHTIGMAKALGTDFSVYAFEPQRLIFQQLCTNITLNGLSNVYAFPYACGNQNEIICIPECNMQQAGNFGGIGIQPSNSLNGQIDKKQTHMATCIRLDDYFVKHDKPIHLIKIDVEGFELQVLSGATQTIQTHRPILYVENDRVETSKQLIEWLWQQNYKVWWHKPSLYSEDNFTKNPNNLFPGLASFNVLALPKEYNIDVALEEITNSDEHPLRK